MIQLIYHLTERCRMIDHTAMHPAHIIGNVRLDCCYFIRIRVVEAEHIFLQHRMPDGGGTALTQRDLPFRNSNHHFAVSCLCLTLNAVPSTRISALPDFTRKGRRESEATSKNASPCNSTRRKSGSQMSGIRIDENSFSRTRVPSFNVMMRCSSAVVVYSVKNSEG